MQDYDSLLMQVTDAIYGTVRVWSLELGPQGEGAEESGDTDTCHWELLVGREWCPHGHT